MITIITGVPGAGKTALLIEMMLEEIKQGRKIYTVGIPGLAIKTHEGGDPRQWQEGNWLKIEKYNPQYATANGLKSNWMPYGCRADCEFISTCPRIGVPKPPDAGSLIVIDEAHTYFPQRSSGKAPPPHVEALTVHRHQGIDIWFVSQKPNFMDEFVRGLASRHIHIGWSPVVLFGYRMLYEWPEFQSTIGRTQKIASSSKKYRPAPHVFPLYQSATQHTKHVTKVPNIVKVFAALVVLLIGFVYFSYNRISTRVQGSPTPVPIAQAAPSGGAAGAGERSAHADGVPPPSGAAQVALRSEPQMVPGTNYPVVDSCIGSSEESKNPSEDFCRCYRGGVRVPVLPAICRHMILEDYVSKPAVTDERSFLPINGDMSRLTIR